MALQLLHAARAVGKEIHILAINAADDEEDFCAALSRAGFYFQAWEPEFLGIDHFEPIPGRSTRRSWVGCPSSGREAQP